MPDLPDGPADVWAHGEAYEPYVGRWSRLVARAWAVRGTRPRAPR